LLICPFCDSNVDADNPADSALEEVLEQGKYHTRPDAFNAMFVIDVDLAVPNRSGSRRQTLAERFDDLSIFHELTTATD